MRKTARTHTHDEHVTLKRRDVSTDPVQTGLVHALGVFLQLEVLAVHAQTLDVRRQVRHVGHPGHRTLGRGCGRIESGRRL